ncbi:MAG: LLM class flavin-dependent oxidoreductase, partial [Chloroflexota bacterium]
GWLPIFFSPERYPEYFKEQVESGFAKAGNGKSIANFDIAPSVYVAMDDNLAMARNQVRPMLALYVGGMGAKGKNFYHDLAVRYGFEAEADKIQDLYLSGDRAGAMVAVPDEMIDAVALVGPRERIAERIDMWKNSDVTTLVVQTNNIETVRALAEMVL